MVLKVDSPITSLDLARVLLFAASNGLLLVVAFLDVEPLRKDKALADTNGAKREAVIMSVIRKEKRSQ